MIRSRVAGGYALLWPYRWLTTHRAAACAAAGVRAEAWRVARGWAVVAFQGAGAPAIHRLPPGSDLEGARRAAVLHLGGGCPCCAARDAAPAVAAEVYAACAVGTGDSILWRRVERLDVVARPGRHDWYVTPAGVRKAARTTDAEEAAIADLAAGLAATRARWTDDELRGFLRRLDDVNWPAATEAQREGAWAAALAIFRQSDVRDLVKRWKEQAVEGALPAAQLARDRLREAVLPQISVALSQPEVEAVRAVGDQAGLFVRDQLGIEAEWLTNRGREIVAAGLRDGLGREAIGAAIREALPEMWGKYGESYATTVASNAVVRARSIAQVAGYREAGIERLEVVAMLDERTCSVCEYMDGEIISVEAVGDLLDRAAEAENVADLQEASPFMRVVRDPETGERSIETSTGTRVAPVDGGGRRLSGTELATAAGVGAPPYHSRCRCTTVPV